jgi:hypothetical protein
MAMPSNDYHRKTVLDRLQSSVRSPPMHSGLAKISFQLGHAGDSEDSDSERKQQRQHAQPHRALLGSDDSPNTLVDDIGPYADDAVLIGLLANLAISTSKDDPVSAEKKGKDGENADGDDVVRSHLMLT